ncbi:MAG: DEAD/DEAH box helicase family protein [Lentisphaeria bacterium]|nr:DEAD/DEAH box helicase family protein [Lentisphaeria bacterium]
MKELKFDANLGFQQEAISAVTDIFAGQKACQSNFTVRQLANELEFKENTMGYANRLELIDEEIADNVHAIQLRNGLEQSSESMIKTRNFSIWMETGTGKTYVYLRTIFELNKLYGFTKFIIVVPSIAIKEGVNNSLALMDSHFKAQYNNVPYDYFVYDSSKLNQVRNFAVSSNIQIMIINIDAFRKVAADPEKESKANIIHRYHDKMLGKPIDFISSCNPVVIIDEPQSVNNTDKAKEALALLNPMCTLRYSATHRKKDRFCMMYKLDSVDAYEQKLVKQIEVAGVQVENSHNKAYIRLVSVSNKNGAVSAKIEIDVLSKGQVTRKTITVKRDDDLFTKSGRRSLYNGYQIDDISCKEGDEYILFVNQDEPLRLDKVLGGVEDDAIKRLQIRKTIEEHLEKELRLRHRGIKVLSLFFIDRVANYRTYDADGNPGKGKFAQWFEEEYRKLIAKPRYDTLFHDVDTTTLPEKVHDGYFSIDKKGAAVDTSESTQAEKDNAERGYQLIMKNKTLLLSFDSPVKFIFSHSALKEGWDNPNVFQICTLNEISSDMRRRQMIGRGLRICVNQDGERVPGFDINTLTVMANESFQDFAENLQHEIEQEEEIKFGQVEEHSFANITVVNAAGEQEYLGLEKSKLVYNYLKEQHYISSTGSVQATLKEALHDDRMEYPAEVSQHSRLLDAVLKKIAGKLNIKNKEEARTITLNKERFLSPEFKELWDRVKYKTTFRVDFDPDALVKACAEALADESKLVVTYPKYIFGRGKVDVTKAGVMITDETGKSEPFTFDDFEYPDVISYLQNETNLTRKSIAQILIDSGRIKDFKINPQMFIDGAIAIIKNVMSKFVVDGIKYHKLGNDNIWAQELFESEEVSGYLNSNMVATPNSGIYEYTVYDSDIEREFAEKLDANEDVKVFAKLPDWFKIPTPLGNYNPDWAILVEKDGQDRLYFVVETKGTDLFGELPPPQQAKIKCGKAHFAALQEDGIKFVAPVATYDRFDDLVNSSKN